MTANERQVGGEHYRENKLQHWDLAVALEMDYFQGQITKYVCRWKKKGGVQDLEKAAHFLEKYIEAVRAGSFSIKQADVVRTINEAYTIKQAEEIREQFIVEGHSEYTCRRCGTHVRARNVFLAFETHGDCAGPNYVNQG